jgi:hypothetical protein
MDWIKQGLDDWRKASSDLRTVTESADDIFNQLWGDIKVIVDAAGRLGIALLTNGSPRSRVVMMVANSSLGNPLLEDRTLAISLAENRRSITAKSDAGETRLEIAVCPDGVVCLKHQSHQITSLAAAKDIMQDFLFKGSSPFPPTGLTV